MKKHNTIKVVLITMLVFLLLSWILPAAYYSGQYVDQGRVQMGLFDLFNYPLTSISYFGYIGLFFILVGGFYGILYKIPAYRIFLERIVKLFEGKEKIALSIMVAIIALLVSICGIQFGIALFIPFIVALILLMGYDKITAALVTVGGAIAGLIGTTYAANNTGVLTGSLALDTDFELFGRRSCYTDDSVMTMAVAEWLMDDPALSHEVLEQKMVKFGNYDSGAGYGGRFLQWLFYPENIWKDGVRRPYNSYGNGSAMRVSAVGWFFDTLEETERVAEISASITHNHPEGIKGAQATAAAIFMARNGKNKEEIRAYISKKYGYELNRTCDQIRPSYGFEVSCQKSVPEAIIAFLDSTDYESTVRLAVSLGGDSDTQACIAGGIAEAFYGMPEGIVTEMTKYLPPDYKNNIIRLAETSAYRCRLEQLKRCWRM